MGLVNGWSEIIEMVIFKRMKVYLVVTGESMERDEEGEMISVKCVCTNNGTEEHPIAKVPLVAREFNTGDKCGESSAGTLCLMAMRRVISGRVWNSVKHFLTWISRSPSIQKCFNMKLETFSSECTWTMCYAQVYVTMFVRLKKQMLDIF